MNITNILTKFGISLGKANISLKERDKITKEVANQIYPNIPSSRDSVIKILNNGYLDGQMLASLEDMELNTD